MNMRKQQRNDKYMYASFFKREARMKIATIRLKFQSLRENARADAGKAMNMRKQTKKW